MSYNLLVIDDHKVVRDGLKAILIAAPEYKVVAEASSGAEAKEKLKANEIDIAFVDLRLPDCNGAILIQEIKALNNNLKCILLTAEPNAADLERAMHAGALGFLTKEIEPDEYFKALNSVKVGKKFISASFSDILINSNLDFSERELEVIQLFAEGLSYKEIAARLSISPRTVETHKKNVQSKMEVNSVVEMVRVAIRRGLISP